MTTTAVSTSSLLGVAADSSAGASSSATSASDFISLLLAELENQDPTDPLDTGELVSQFSSISLVEQSIQTNSYLEALSQYASSVNNAQAVSCIGKSVTATDTDSNSVTAAITGVLYSGGTTYLITSDGSQIPYSQVTAVNAA